jgi:hypothetical protein
MVYNVTKYDGSPLASVQDSTLDTTSTSITLIGRNVVNFGLALNENFVALMQNFANTAPPPSPIQGQIWYDTVGSSLKVYDGTAWILITPPFDGNAGTATVSVTSSIEIMVVLSAGQIISAFSHEFLAPSQLSDEVQIAGTSYLFKAKFPNGIFPGITMADGNDYGLFGRAQTANALTTSRNIGLTGSLTGNVLFDGSNDVVMTTSLINVLNANLATDGYWTKVKIGGNGLITDANVIVDSDVVQALGYTPPSQVVIDGDVIGNSIANGTVFSINVTISNTGITPGSYSNVTVDSTGRVIAGSNDNPIPVKGIILWNDPLIPNGWAQCDGSNIATPNGTISLPNIPSIGQVRYIMKIQ